jgi:outer membrane receptor protein involved in Fe transport
MEQNWIKKHVDTVIVLGGIISSLLWMNHKFAEVDKRFAIGDQQNLFPQLRRYYTVDWNIKYDFKNIELWSGLNNIFNKRYATFGAVSGGRDQVGFYPAPGRNIVAGVKVKF